MTGDVSQAEKHMKQIMGEILALSGKTKEEQIMVAREIEAPIELVMETAKMQRLPVINFAAGGTATPADAAIEEVCNYPSGKLVILDNSIRKEIEPEFENQLLWLSLPHAMTKILSGYAVASRLNPQTVNYMKSGTV